MYILFQRPKQYAQQSQRAVLKLFYQPILTKPIVNTEHFWWKKTENNSLYAT